MVNMNGSGTYFVITPVILVIVPGAGALVTGFSSSTWMSALLAAWFSSVIAASMVSVVAETIFTGISSLASPFFSMVRMDCQTLSAASLLAGEQFAFDRMNSLSLNPRVAGSFSWTAFTARSHGVGAGFIRFGKSGGSAVSLAVDARSSFQPSSPP